MPALDTEIVVETPFTCGTEAAWFSTKMPLAPALTVTPANVITLELPSPEIATIPFDVVLVVVPVIVAVPPITTSRGPPPDVTLAPDVTALMPTWPPDTLP